MKFGSLLFISHHVYLSSVRSSLVQKKKNHVADLRSRQKKTKNFFRLLSYTLCRYSTWKKRLINTRREGAGLASIGLAFGPSLNSTDSRL